MAIKAASLHKTKGNVLVLTAFALFVLMGMAAIAVDLSHAETNKTRLQNLADALALSAAISLNRQESSGTISDIEEYAENYAKTVTLPDFKSASGNNEVTLTTADFDFTFATNWSPTSGWVAADAIDGAHFARVVTKNPLNLATWFARVINFNNMAVSASAVAGTTPIVPCSDVLPVIACANVNNSKPKSADAVCGTGGKCFGYAMNTVFCFKASSGNKSNLNCPAVSSDYMGGPQGISGNFGWMSVGNGAKSINDCAAGNPGCQIQFCTNYAASATISSQTGNIAAIEQGFNTRFDIYKGSYTDPTQYPPDYIVGYAPSSTTADNKTRSADNANNITIPQPPNVQAISTTTSNPTNLYVNNYKPLIDSGATSDATNTPQNNRRVLAAPFIDCTQVQKTKGGFTVPSSAVVGWGCLFITQPMPTGSPTSIYAELIDNTNNCQGMGLDVSNINTGFYKVILYKDPFGGQS